ncbi:MAG: carboxypeptidase-like regulatory domain-containing protein [Thermoguttaceae bacterium]|nr:carboxypeptidase-like regulatory domain-containing protein [Thermoguttaceae bacterium]MDW8078979.1 carboxypeptidase regulatory-like domain-containing protein [Thermoguttaceae bacterium]
MRTGEKGWPSLLAAGLALALLGPAGCKRGDPNFATVYGEIRLDGQPLAGALVEFDPENGSPSYGITDPYGRYTLRFNHQQAGALIGRHTVRITTRRTTVDNNGRTIILPEKIPPQYNWRSTLSAEVRPGSNRYDFDLKTR